MSTTSSQMYSDAVAALTALGDRLRSSGGAFFFGSRPSSLDAILAGHLIYYRLCPAAPPILQQKVGEQRRTDRSPIMCDGEALPIVIAITATNIGSDPPLRSRCPTWRSFVITLITS